MTLSQGPLENIYRLTLLRGADVAVDLHRRLAQRVTQQLLAAKFRMYSTALAPVAGAPRPRVD